MTLAQDFEDFVKLLNKHQNLLIGNSFRINYFRNS